MPLLFSLYVPAALVFDGSVAVNYSYGLVRFYF